MMQMAQPSVPQVANVLALHQFCFGNQCSTVIYLQLIEILHLNPNPLGFSHGYVSQEHLSFIEDYIIAFVFQYCD